MHETGPFPHQKQMEMLDNIEHFKYLINMQLSSRVKKEIPKFKKKDEKTQN